MVSHPSDEPVLAEPSGDQPTKLAQVHGALLGVMHVIHAHTERCAADLGLTALQAITLFHLHQSGPRPMRELAAEQHCDPSNITGLADRLEARGLVERRADPSDRRVKLLALTPEGEAVTARLGELATTGVPGLSELSEGELGELLALLSRVLRAAGAEPVHSAPSDRTPAP